MRDGQELRIVSFVKWFMHVFLNKHNQKTYAFMVWFTLPALLYLVLFYILQPNYLFNFSNGFFLDNGDGFQNVWNIWWVDKSLTDLHTNPYFTTDLHWPHGVTLIPQTMNIFNGLVGLPLMGIFGFSLVQTVNFAVLSAFVFGGVTMFWFIHKLHKSYWVALLGGALFTFSSFHFAHAQGHLQLVSLQFIPLFLLAFWTFLEKLTYRRALAAAGSLFLVLLCDYYYLMWCVLVGAMWVGWLLYKKQLKITKQNLKVMAVFAGTTLLLTGPLLYKLVTLNKTDPLTGFHDPVMFSLDPLMLLAPGGSWYWHTLTDGFTQYFPYFAESSVFFGYGVLAVLAYGFYRLVRKRGRIGTPHWLTFWWVVLIVFAVMSLGPRLTVAQHKYLWLKLPYALAAKLFPTLQVSGMPIRWILVSLIAAIVIATYWLSRLNLQKANARIVLVAFVVVAIVDIWPRPLPLTPLTYRSYVYELKKLPHGAVIDNGALSGAEQLYNQTLHNKPQAFGYVTRVPSSVEVKDFQIFAALEQKRYAELCRTHRVRYLTLPVERPIETEFPVIYDDGETLIYDLKNSPSC